MHNFSGMISQLCAYVSMRNNSQWFALIFYILVECCHWSRRLATESKSFRASFSSIHAHNCRRISFQWNLERILEIEVSVIIINGIKLEFLARWTRCRNCCLLIKPKARKLHKKMIWFEWAFKRARKTKRSFSCTTLTLSAPRIEIDL